MYVARLSPSASPSASASPSSAVDFTRLKEELWASAADKHEHEELRCVELQEDVAARNYASPHCIKGLLIG